MDRFSRGILAAWAAASCSVASAAQIETGALNGKLTVETRAELESNDHGFAKTDSVDPVQTTNLQLDLARLNLAGDAAEGVKYRLRLNALKNADVEYGFVELALGGPLTVLVGKTKLLQGGWYQLASSVDKAIKSPYLAHAKPFSSYQPTLELGLKLAGKVSLQLTDDVTTEDDGQWNKSHQQPAWILAWQGDIGGVQPLLEVGQYDINHSRFIAVGVKGQAANLHWLVDYVMDSRSIKVGEGDDAKDEFAEITSVTVDVSYRIEGVAQPYVTYSMLDIKQPLEDQKGNSIDEDGNPSWDDNGTELAIGSFIETWGPKARPYVQAVIASATFLEGDEEEKKSQTSFHVGITSKI